MVKVVWKDVAGDRCWFASGTGEAKPQATCLTGAKTLRAANPEPPASWRKAPCFSRHGLAGPVSSDGDFAGLAGFRLREVDREQALFA